MSNTVGFLSIALRFEDVDVLADSDALDITTGWQPYRGCGLVIHAPDDTFWAEVVSVKRLPWGGKHVFRVKVACDRMEELRKAFTYEVAR